jgi:hypothetical protein
MRFRKIFRAGMHFSIAVHEFMRYECNMEDAFTFPLIRIEDMPEKLKDWLISRSLATRKNVAEVAMDVLRAGAAKDGFPPKSPDPKSGEEGRAA